MPNSTLISRRTVLGLGIAALAGVGGLALHEGADAITLSGVNGRVNTDGVNLRSGPSTSASVIAQLRSGTAVACSDTRGSWFKVTTSTLGGWISSRFVTLIPSVSTPTVDRGPSGRARVALTFDAGADRGNAAAILDTLKSARVRATFGITGRWCDANADLVRRIANEGHTLTNHTLTHRSMTGFSNPDAMLTPAERVGELIATEKKLKAACGKVGRPLFRPPYGDYDAGVLNDVAAAGFAYNVMWSVDSLGWRGLSADEIVDRCLSSMGNGFIYLFHVGSASADAEALPRLIAGFRGAAFQMTTVDRLLGLRPIASPSPTPTSAATAHLAARPARTATPSKTPLPGPATSTAAPIATPPTPTPLPTEPPTATPIAEPTLDPTFGTPVA